MYVFELCLIKYKHTYLFNVKMSTAVVECNHVHLQVLCLSRLTILRCLYLKYHAL